MSPPPYALIIILLPVRVSEQGNVIGSVRIILVIVITRAEDIMADNSPSPRAHLRTTTIIAIISEVTGYNYFISYLPIP